MIWSSASPAAICLFTPGCAIPNVALVKPFNITWDIGLDGVQFIGTIVNILNFVNGLSQYPRDKFLQDPGLLQTLLNQNKIDIWFTVEGTAAIGTHGQVLDGDLLSAATGTIIVSQAALLPANVPAGLLQRGVDFGLDGVMTPRDPAQALTALRFSTEILYNGGTSFTDGDILLLGDGIVTTNSALIQPFHPAADFLGLDALSSGPGVSPPTGPHIQKLCGEQSVGDFNGGMVPIGVGGTGLYQGPFGGASGSFNGPIGDPTTHDPRGQPCGNFVPIDGFLPPAANVSWFRVAYRLYTDPYQGPGFHPGIRTQWRLSKPQGGPCSPYDWNTPLWLPTTSDGWMDAVAWSDAISPAPSNGCVNNNLHMAVWDTTSDQGTGWGPSNKDGHYVLWLEWKIGTSTTVYREQYDHHLQLDNTPPTIAAYPDGLKVYVNNLNNTQGPWIPACGTETSHAHELQIWGQFYDAYYSRFSLQASGGNPPWSAGFGPHKWWDSDDGTVIPPPIKNTNSTGTTSPSTPVHLRDINMATALGAHFTQCCYDLTLRVWDAAILHSFSPWNVGAYEQGPHYASQFITFSAGP